MEFAVIGAELADLGFEELEVFREARVVARLRGEFVVATLIRIVGVVPVGDGVIKAERKFSSMAGVGELADDVLAVGGN